MKILKRILKVILFFITLPLIFIEVPFYGIRWILTGAEFGYQPICIYFLFDF